MQPLRACFLLLVSLSMFLGGCDTPRSRGEIDDQGRGPAISSVDVLHGSPCGHVNCGGSLDVVLMRVVRCSDDVVVIERDIGQSTACVNELAANGGHQ